MLDCHQILIDVGPSSDQADLSLCHDRTRLYKLSVCGAGSLTLCGAPKIQLHIVVAARLGV